VTCERCYQPTDQGAHGLNLCPLEPRRTVHVKPDTLVGGFLAQNAWREPRYFDSQKAYERALDADGMMLKPPKAKGASPITADSLEAARRLVERVTARTMVYPMTTRILDETVTVQADLCK
jgi:hypothetical protein